MSNSDAFWTLIKIHGHSVTPYLFVSMHPEAIIVLKFLFARLTVWIRFYWTSLSLFTLGHCLKLGANGEWGSGSINWNFWVSRANQCTEALPGTLRGAALGLNRWAIVSKVVWPGVRGLSVAFLNGSCPPGRGLGHGEHHTWDTKGDRSFSMNLAPQGVVWVMEDVTPE